MNSGSIRKLVFSAMFAALVFTATWISFPTGLGGNVNLGDGMLLLAAWTLGGPWSVFACAIGAALTDLIGGFAMYAPGTFVIKALMVVAALLIRKITKRLPLRFSYVLSALVAEAVMVLGYFVYEATALGLGIAAAASIPFNLLQAVAAIIVGTLLHMLLTKAHLQDALKS